MYTIQSPSGITIVMDAAFYLCAIRATIFFSLIIELIGLHVRAPFLGEKRESRKELYMRKFKWSNI